MPWKFMILCGGKKFFLMFFSNENRFFYRKSRTNVRKTKWNYYSQRENLSHKKRWKFQVNDVIMIEKIFYFFWESEDMLWSSKIEKKIPFLTKFVLPLENFSQGLFSSNHLWHVAFLSIEKILKETFSCRQNQK